MRTSRRWWLVFFLGPAIALFAAFITYPILSALAFSLYAWEGIGRRGFVGLANFARLFATFPYAGLLVNAFWHNVLVFVATMLLQNVTALALAVLLARGPWGARGYRVIFFLPVMLSLVIVGFLWGLFLNPVFGLVNKVLTLLHAGALARPWLGDASTALLTLIVVNAWRWLGFPTIVFLAGINAVPEEYVEAARIDGAGGSWRDARRGRPHRGPMRHAAQRVPRAGAHGHHGGVGVQEHPRDLPAPVRAARGVAVGELRACVGGGQVRAVLPQQCPRHHRLRRHRRDPGGHGRVRAGPVPLPRKRSRLSLLPQRVDAADPPRDHPAVHPDAHLTSARHPVGADPDLRRLGAAQRGVHPDRVLPDAARGPGQRRAHRRRRGVADLPADHGAAGAAGPGHRGRVQSHSHLERFLLPPGVHPDQPVENLAAGDDHVLRPVLHRLGRAVRRPQAGRGAGRGALCAGVAAVHPRARSGRVEGVRTA